MKSIAPYQVFFPLGVLNALLAVGVWFIKDLGWFSTPTLLIHAKLVAGGFLWSFIVGFLMTALPRMSGTQSANIFEYIISIGLFIVLTLSAWQIDGRFFYATQIALIIFVIFYAGRRLIKTIKPLPIFVSHILIAMVLALIGCIYHFNGNSYMGLHLYHLGATLLLVLGIGTRFFAFLSGLSSDFENSNKPFSRIMFHMNGVFTGLFLYIAGSGLRWAYLGLTLTSLLYLFKIWRVQRTSDRPSALKYAMQAVAAMIPLSFFLTWWMPALFISWFHLLFIGCFALITFSVASRVTLAHGSYSLDFEIKSRGLWYLLTFLVLGSASRVLYGLTSGLWQKSYLHLAATFWFAALFIWGKEFLPRIFKKGPQEKASC